MAASALAIDFENPPYSGSAGGTLLTGQDGWYLPVVGSTDWNVHTYAGNTLGVVANPAGGGSQFAAGVSQGTTPSTAFARAQRAENWGASPAFVVSYDVNHQYLGQLPTAQNLGSWSLQPSTTAITGQDLHVWDDINTAASWSLQFNLFDAAGAPILNQSPGASWVGLQLNHWYRVEHTISFVNNQWTSTSITDLHTNVTDTFNTTSWYMSGGTNPILPMPTDHRFFAGGNTGNTFAVDNLSITPVPEPGTFIAIGAGLALLALRRRRS
jgi:hypothetical protein